MHERYEIQTIADATTAAGVHYRITEIAGDNRIATSYLLENAERVTDALNGGVRAEREIRYLRTAANMAVTVLAELLKSQNTVIGLDDAGAERMARDMVARRMPDL